MQVMLAKYSQQDDIVVGTPYANRDPPEVEGILGSFVKYDDSHAFSVCNAGC